MTVVLSGGIDQHTARPIASRLLRDIAAAQSQNADTASGVPVIGVIIRGSESPLVLAELGAAFGDGSCEFRALDGEIQPGDILGLDAIVIADGDAAQLLRACASVLTDLRGLVQRGTAFWGIGAGAAIAADMAVTDGFEIGGVAVAPRISTDVATEVQLAQGLGLVDITVIPGAAQLGRLGIGIAACEAGLLDRAIALDANTSLLISDGGITLHGSGSMWEITASDHGVQVSSRSAQDA